MSEKLNSTEWIPTSLQNSILPDCVVSILHFYKLGFPTVYGDHFVSIDSEVKNCLLSTPTNLFNCQQTLADYCPEKNK